MKEIQQKLQENKNKIKRQKFLSAIDSQFQEFLARAEYSSEASCLKYAAFPRWDKKANILTTTRGNVKNWNNFMFKSWHELMAVLNTFQKVRNYIGWFFIDADGPYYKISLNAFLSHIPNLSNYFISHEHNTFGWVGDVDDVGILIGKNHGSPDKQELQISIWGM